VWHLNQPAKQSGALMTGEILQLIQHKMISSSPFHISRLFVNNKFIVALLQNLADVVSFMFAIDVEIRSTTNFDLIYKVSEHVTYLTCFRFVHDILSIQVGKQPVHPGSKPPILLK
jgi:hypothetical protein